MYTQQEEPLVAADVPQFLADLEEKQKDWEAYFNDLRRSEIVWHDLIDLAEKQMQEMFETLSGIPKL